MIYDMDQSLTPQQNIDRWQAREHMERQTAALESRHPQRQNGGAASVGYAGGQLIGNAAAAVGAYAGTKAGQAHYERTGDLKEAMWLGAIAGRRWFVWTLAWVVWMIMVLITFCIMMGANVDFQDYEMYPGPNTLIAFQESKAMFYAWLLTLPIVFVLMLVLYKRNVDFSLAKRRSVYYLIKPVAVLLFWAPNWLLYAGFVIVPVTLQFVFDTNRT